MTQEEKQLVLKTLCSMLPYGVKVQVYDNRYAPVILTQIDVKKQECIFNFNVPVENCLPYLRSMSSMTEEEKNELRNILWFGYPSDDNDNYSHRGIEVKQCLYDDEKHSTYDFDDFRALQNFLLKNHFDYCGLIEKGLALEAPSNMYK